MVFIICADDGQEKINEDAPENNPQYTTVYVGNLAPEVNIFFPFLILKNKTKN